MNTVLVIFAATGAAVWVLISLALVAFVILGVVPAVWRAICYAGYAAFAEKAEKDAIRERARRSAPNPPAEGGE